MSIATDPKVDSLEDEQDEFEKHFNDYASGKKPDPEPEKDQEPVPSEGNDPEDEPAAPAEEPPKEGEPAATEEGEPSETVTSDDAEPEGGAKPPEGEQAPDPLEGVPQEIREQIAQLTRERDDARHRASSDANRVAALSRKLQQLTAGQTSSGSQPPEKPTEAQAALDKKIEQLRKDYGEIAEPLIELIEVQKQELNSVRASLTGLSETQQAQVIAQETAALEARHPDWRGIAQSPDFAAWIEVQPENIQRLAQSWDARETSVVLTLFKAERVEPSGQSGQSQQADPQPKAPAPKADAATGARRSQQLEGGRDVRSRPAPAASEPPDDFDAAFKYFEEKRRAKALSASR